MAATDRGTPFGIIALVIVCAVAGSLCLLCFLWKNRCIPCFNQHWRRQAMLPTIAGPPSSPAKNKQDDMIYSARNRGDFSQSPTPSNSIITGQHSRICVGSSMPRSESNRTPQRYHVPLMAATLDVKRPKTKSLQATIQPRDAAHPTTPRLLGGYKPGARVTPSPAAHVKAVAPASILNQVRGEAGVQPTPPRSRKPVTTDGFARRSDTVRRPSKAPTDHFLREQQASKAPAIGVRARDARPVTIDPTVSRSRPQSQVNSSVYLKNGQASSAILKDKRAVSFNPSFTIRDVPRASGKNSRSVSDSFQSSSEAARYRKAQNLA